MIEPPVHGTPRLFTLAQTAAQLQVSKEWLRKRVQSKQVPHIRMGRGIRFTSAQIDLIIAAGERCAQLPAKPRSRGSARTRL